MIYENIIQYFCYEEPLRGIHGENYLNYQEDMIQKHAP